MYLFVSNYIIYLSQITKQRYTKIQLQNMGKTPFFKTKKILWRQLEKF